MIAQIFRSVLNMSLTGVYVILAVMILRLCIRRAPKWISYALWLVVLFRLICPVTFESGISLLPSAEPVPKEIFSEAPAIHSGIPALNQAINPVLQDSLAPTPGASANPAQIWMFILSLVWLAGAALMLLYGLIAMLRFAKRLRFAVLLQEGVYESEEIETAFVWGLFRPRIYVPSGLNELQLKQILAHERVHIRRLDNFTRPLSYIVLSLHWFNPLVWMAFVCSRRDMEISCDESVLRREGADRQAYAGTLLSVSERCSGIALPLAFGESDTGKRIKNVLAYKKPAFWLVAVALLTALVAALCLIANPRREMAKAAELPQGIFGTTYAFDECLYMNPLSSFYPFDGTGMRYRVTEEGSLDIINEETGALLESHGGDSWHGEFDEDEWESLFFAGIPYDISGYSSRLQYAIADEYRLYCMDGEIWLGRLANDGTMWSLYRLRPAEERIAEAGGAEGPESVFASESKSELLLAQAQRREKYLGEFSMNPRGEEGFGRKYEGDWDEDGKTDKAAFEELPSEIEGYSDNRAVTVQFGDGERISADSLQLAEISAWGSSFLLEAADLTGDGSNEIILLIDIGGAGGRGSYALYPYMRGSDGWAAMAPPKSGVELSLEWKDNIATVKSGDYSEIVAGADMLRLKYAQEGAEAEWKRVDGTEYHNESAADAICDIALVPGNGKTLVKSSQYVTGVTGVHVDQLGYLVTTYEWAQDGSFSVRDMQFVYLPQ